MIGLREMKQRKESGSRRSTRAEVAPRAGQEIQSETTSGTQRVSLEEAIAQYIRLKKESSENAED